MNYRKTAAFLMIAASPMALVNAQNTKTSPSGTGFYISVNGGYNLPVNSKGSPYFYANNEIYQPGTNPVEVVPFSLGKGPSVGIDIGYMFTQNIGAELGIDYLFGSRTTFRETDTQFPTYTADQNLCGKMLQFKPAMVFSAGTGNLKPYAKAGVVIGVASKITSEYEVRETASQSASDWHEEYTGGLAVGFHGALGLDYLLNSKVSVFGELTAVGLNYSPDKGEVIKAVDNGQDYLNDLTTSEREIEFVNSTDGTVTSSNQPRKELKFSAPFSNVGLNIGFKYHF